MLIYNGMGKKIVIYSHNEILHSTRKKQTVTTYNIYGSNNLRLSKKQKFMQYDSTYIELKIWGKLNYNIGDTYNNDKYPI